MKGKKKLNKKFIKMSMKQKLNDACVVVNGLRQRRDKLRLKLINNGDIEKSEARKIMRECSERVSVKKLQQREKNMRKYNRNKWKQECIMMDDELPEEVKKFTDGINIFTKDLEPEPPIGPMICDKNIKLDEDELKLLTKGPKFMKRNDIDINEFVVEVEKMIVKHEYNRDDDKIETEDIE